MADHQEEIMEPHRQDSNMTESMKAQGLQTRTIEKDEPRKNENVASDRQPNSVSNGAKKVRKRIIQHPGELPRNQPSVQTQSAARRAYESRIAPDERIQQKLTKLRGERPQDTRPSEHTQQKQPHHEEERGRESHPDDDPESFYRLASQPVPTRTRSKTQQQQQNQSNVGQAQNNGRESTQPRHTNHLQQQYKQEAQNGHPQDDGRGSAQSRRTSEKGHKKQLSQAEVEEFYERLATPKYITPKKPKLNQTRPKTDREMARSAIYHGSAGARSKAAELPFNDHWSNSKIEREEDIQMTDVPMDKEGQIMDGQGRMHDTMNGPHHGPPGQFIDDSINTEQQQQSSSNDGAHDTLSGFASMIGWDNRHQRQMEMEINTLRKRLWHSQKKNDELNHHLSDLSHANDGLQADLRKVQQKSFGAMAKNVWTPLEDRAVEEVLQEIHCDIEEWADENCKESFADVLDGLDEKQQRELFELCGKVADVTQSDLKSQLQWWEARDLDPVLLLTSLVTFRMYDCVFNNHFLALGALDEVHIETMSDVYRELAKLDFKQAQVWRSQLMRILVGSPQSGGRFDGVSSKLDMSKFMKRYCDDLLDDYKSYPEFAFLKTELSPESRVGLLTCWQKAMELNMQLQTQVAALQWTATDTLRSSVNPRFVESHRSQAFPKGRNDGKPISLVISPMVTFFGNEDGERYQDWRAICKATVLVIEREIESSEEEDALDGDMMDEDATENSAQGENAKQLEKCIDDGEIL